MIFIMMMNERPLHDFFDDIIYAYSRALFLL